MFYIERSIQGPVLCSDIHDCYGTMENGELGWICNGLYAIGFKTKIEAEDFAKSHGFNFWVPASEYDPRYLIVEELRIPEIDDIAKKYNARLADSVISWDNDEYNIKVVTNIDVNSSPYRKMYVYVVGARLMYAGKVLDEIFNPTYEQMDKFVKNCVTSKDY